MQCIGFPKVICVAAQCGAPWFSSNFGNHFYYRRDAPSAFGQPPHSLLCNSFVCVHKCVLFQIGIVCQGCFATTNETLAATIASLKLGLPFSFFAVDRSWRLAAFSGRNAEIGMAKMHLPDSVRLWQAVRATIGAEIQAWELTAKPNLLAPIAQY
jgi:hypothetical protein